MIKKRKKVLFFGLGSIGKRHLALLKKNYDYEIFAYRKIKKDTIGGVKNLYNINDIFKIDADIAFVTNPTHLHIKTALLCLENGVKNIFIEKPLTHNLNDIDKFMKKADKNEVLIYVGHVLRYNPVLIRLKGLIDELIDKVFYSFTFCRSYLPEWHTGRDYREIYSSKKDQGGGVILDLIHEFDFNQWLFGKIKLITGQYGKISPLEIDSEDFCDLSIVFENNINGFIHLDYFSRHNQRKISVLTKNKEIIADLINNEILIINGKGIKKVNFNFEIDYIYELQLEDFLNAVENEAKDFGNLKESEELIKKLINFKNNNKMIINSKYL